MALQEGERRNARSIVVGTDGSKPADEAVRQATDMASREGARLHLVTAYPDPQMLREPTTIWAIDPKGVMDSGGTAISGRYGKRSGHAGLSNSSDLSR